MRGQFRHDGVGAFVDRHIHFLPMADQRDLACRYAPLFDVALGSLDYDRAARSHEGARDRHDTPGLFRIEMEESGDVVGVTKLLDGASGLGYFHRRRHSHRHAVDVLDLVDDRHRLLQPVVNEYAIVFLDD